MARSPYYLCVFHDAGNWHIFGRCTREDPLRDEPFHKDVRISPIFPIGIPRQQLPDFTGDGYIAFLFPERQYRALSKICAYLSDEEAEGLWYTHGLSNPLVITRDRELIEKVTHAYDSWRAYEIWRYSDGRLTQEPEIWKCKPHQIDNRRYTLNRFGYLPHDFRHLLIEVGALLQTAVARAAQYSPHHLNTYATLCRDINDSIAAVAWYVDPDEHPYPTHLPADAEVILRADSLARTRRVHHLTAELVQVNSALSYVVSQAYSGTCPILENRAVAVNYSLLGLGGAFNGIYRLAGHVLSRFAQTPVTTLIESHYHGISAPASEFLGPTGFGEDIAVDVDRLLHRTRAVEVEMKLVHFSGRLGFKESTHTVTSAMQVLHGAATERWSLMTYTHELIHAHVRSLLAVVFGTTGEEYLPDAFDGYHRQLQEILSGKRKEATVNDFIRFKILLFCNDCITYRHLEKAYFEGKRKKSATINSHLRPWPQIHDELQRQLRLIHEHIVHILDYHYIYDGQDEIYMRLLWKSWAYVPHVIDNLPEYILRSIVAVSSKMIGDIQDVFDRAYNTVAVNLGILKEEESDITRHVLEKAYKYMVSDEESEGEEFDVNEDSYRRLRYRFYPCVHLILVTLRFLQSNTIYAEILHDDNRDVATDTHQYSYKLGTCRFDDVEIHSPVAFLAHRLLKSQECFENDRSLEAVSTWILLVCGN